MLSIFSCVCQLSVCLLWRDVCLGLLPIFIGLFYIYIYRERERSISCLYIRRLILCQCFVCKAFSHFEGCLLVYGFFCCAKAFKFNQVSIIYFLFLFSLFQKVGQKRSCYDLCQRVIFFLFSSKSFVVSDLTFRSLIHFKFIFVYGVREWSNIIPAVQISQHHLLKRLFFLHCIFLPPLLQIR